MFELKDKDGTTIRLEDTVLLPSGGEAMVVAFFSETEVQVVVPEGSAQVFPPSELKVTESLYADIENLDSDQLAALFLRVQEKNATVTVGKKRAAKAKTEEAKPQEF